MVVVFLMNKRGTRHFPKGERRFFSSRASPASLQPRSPASKSRWIRPNHCPFASEWILVLSLSRFLWFEEIVNFINGRSQ